MTRYGMVCIGTSWGGLSALRTILRGLGDALPLAVVAIQHRHRDSDSLLAHLLQDCTPMPVVEVEDKDPIETGRVYVAPADYHLLIDDGHFALTTDAPVRFSRPSIDVTFSSAADEFGPRVIGVVLTGANADGAEGLRRIAAAGGAAIVESPETAESATMPAAALRAVPEARALPVAAIAGYLRELAAPAPPPGARPATSAPHRPPGEHAPLEAPRPIRDRQPEGPTGPGTERSREAR